MVLPSRILALGLLLVLGSGCHSKPPVPASELLQTASDARKAADWSAAAQAFTQAREAAEAAHDEPTATLARRGQLQAQSVSDPAAALAAAEAWLDELGPAASVDLYGGLATDFRFTGAVAEGVILCDRGLAAYPGDVGLRNAKERLEAALPKPADGL